MKDLWRSHATGRIRRGTRVAELRRLFDERVTVSAICEPLDCCLADDPANEIAERMRELKFDEIGLKPDENAAVTGYVRMVDLCTGPCAAYRRDFLQTDLIADSTSMVEVLLSLRDDARKYVLFGRQVGAIVTRADLQKPPVRMLVFGLITLLEIHLSFLVRHIYQDDAWQQALSKTRLAAARRLMKERAARGEELGLLDCLQFCDKRELVVREKRGLEVLDLPSRSAGRRLLKAIEALRDKVAHAQDLVSGTTWESVIETVAQTEALVARSEQLVDVAAVT